MRNVLLGGKLIAIEAGDARITVEHLCLSLQYLKPLESSAYSTLCSALGVSCDTAEPGEKFTNALLEEVAAKPRLPYSSEVISLLDNLRADGIDTASKITEPFINLGNRKNLYREVIAEVAELKALLQSRIFDQDHAVEAVSDAVMRMSWSNLADRPQAIFSFLGPPATGKTYMAKLMGLGLQGYELRSFDMTQFSSEKESFGLVGLRKGFSDASPGMLTDFVKRNPCSILVFDEIEKSHTRVQTALLRMLSEGFLRDEYTGEEIDFRKTIVVFTSNLGSSLYSNRAFIEQARHYPHQAREHLLQAIRQETKLEDGHSVSAIPPEMVSRLSQGSVVLFNRLSMRALAQIAQDQIALECKNFETGLGLSVSFPQLEILAQLVVLGFAPEFDARALKSRLADQIFDPITDYLLAHKEATIEQVDVVVDEQAERFLSDQDLEHLPQQLATRHQRIYFDYCFEASAGHLRVICNRARIEKLARSDDFSDSSGIQVDLPEVNFEDIAGHSLIKSRLKEAINLVKQRSRLSEQGISIPRGMLLYGEPGTGKTMLAKAFANEAGLPFLACSGNDLLDEEFIRKLFNRAREYAPALVFIDEIDALPKRGTAGPHADALVNRLLVEVDGFGGGADLFIVAATNRRELIDPALLRSGRIDLHFEVPQLDKEARRWFINRMLENPLFQSDINVDQLVMLSAGFSGADLEKTNREVILTALRDRADQVGMKRIIEQINTQKYGAPLDLKDSFEQLQETAYHEAGHAVVSRVLMPERIIEQITVVARANFMGMVAYDREQQHDYTRDFLFGLTCVALAGRAAQLHRFGCKGMDSGAAGDLNQAAHYAWLAVAEWGMDDTLYNVPVSALKQHLGNMPFMDRVEGRIEHWLLQATEHTRLLIEKKWPQIERVAQRLLDDETVDAATLDHLMENE